MYTENYTEKLFRNAIYITFYTRDVSARVCLAQLEIAKNCLGNIDSARV